MRQILGSVLAVLLTCFLPPTAFAEKGQPFYFALDPSVQTKEGLIRKIEARGFRVPAAVLAQEVGKAAGVSLATREDLLAFIRSDEVTVTRCDWPVQDPAVAIEYIKPVSSAQTPKKKDQRRVFSFGTFHRSCYDGEMMLVYRDRVFISLMCGNPILDRRKPQRIASPPPAPAAPAPPVVVAPPAPKPLVPSGVAGPPAPPVPIPAGPALVLKPCAPSSVASVRLSGISLFTGTVNSNTGPAAGLSLSPGFLKEETASCR